MRRALALLGLCLLPLAARAEERLVIAGDLWCPVNCAPDSERPGIYVELAREIFAEAGIAVEYRLVNWARALREAREGRIDAVIGAARSDAPDLLFGVEPTSSSRNCFYTAGKEAWRYAGPDDLAGRRLAVVNDYSYGARLDAYIQAGRGDPARIQAAAGEQALALNLAKLLEGRVDALLENRWVMQDYLARRGYTGTLREAGCERPDIPIYLAFSPALQSSPRYLRLLDEGLRRYRADGRMQRLLARYGVTEAN